MLALIQIHGGTDPDPNIFFGGFQDAKTLSIFVLFLLDLKSQYCRNLLTIISVRPGVEEEIK